MDIPYVKAVVMGDAVPEIFENFTSMLECSLPLTRAGAVDLYVFNSSAEIMQSVLRYAHEHGIRAQVIAPADAYVSATHLLAFFKAGTVRQQYDPTLFQGLVTKPRLFLL